MDDLTESIYRVREKLEDPVMNAVDWQSFINGLRKDQDRLRDELRPYENGGMRVGRKPENGQWEDFTDERISAIKREITNIEKTIQLVSTLYI